MPPIVNAGMTAVALVVAATAWSARPVAATDWPEFRGSDGSGVAVGETISTRWSRDEGVAWRSDLPGRGLSSPIVVGDSVVVTASDGARQDRLHVLAFDREKGTRRWQRSFWAAGRTFCHSTSAVAAGTPASDGRRIVAALLVVRPGGRRHGGPAPLAAKPRRRASAGGQRRRHGDEPADHRRRRRRADRLPGRRLRDRHRRRDRRGPVARAPEDHRELVDAAGLHSGRRREVRRPAKPRGDRGTAGEGRLARVELEGHVRRDRHGGRRAPTGCSCPATGCRPSGP